MKRNTRVLKENKVQGIYYESTEGKASMGCGRKYIEGTGKWICNKVFRRKSLAELRNKNN